MCDEWVALTGKRSGGSRGPRAGWWNARNAARDRFAHRSGPFEPGGRTGVLVLAVVLLCPSPSSGQTRWRGVSLQGGFAAGTAEFAGTGAAVTAEVGIWSDVRVFGQWTAWSGVDCGPILDAPNPCNIASATSWDLGLRTGIGISQSVAPFAGVGLGLYRQRGPTADDRTRSLSFSLSAGVDFPVRPPVTIRLSIEYHEVVDRELTERYGVGVRFGSMLAGVSVATW